MPTVAVGPDGAYYVGELTGFPFVPGSANIYRVGHADESPEVCLTGFTTIIDIPFDHQGNLYVLDYAGTLTRVALDTHATRDSADHGGTCAKYAGGARKIVVSGLSQPTSVAVGPDGGPYISNRGSSPGTGEVIRFEPPVE